jgi:hypothetical protein
LTKSDLVRESFVMSGRAKRVLIYTVTLLTAPMPVMPFARGTREYALAGAACGAVLALSSFYVARGELRLKHRGLLGNKLVAASLITLLFGVSLALVGSVAYFRLAASEH